LKKERGSRPVTGEEKGKKGPLNLNFRAFRKEHCAFSPTKIYTEKSPDRRTVRVLRGKYNERDRSGLPKNNPEGDYRGKGESGGHWVLLLSIELSPEESLRGRAGIAAPRWNRYQGRD